MIAPLRPYPEYKSSGVPWAGEIPRHWEISRNGRLFMQRNQTGRPDLPILEVSIRGGVAVRDLDAGTRKQTLGQRESYKWAAKGDIAYNTMRMWQGAVGVAPSDGLVSPAYVVARPRADVDSRYFAYLFRTPAYMDEINSESRGIVSDRNRLYWEDFKQISATIPPLSEQRTIADYLDAYAAWTRRAIHTKQRLVELLKEQKQAIIHRAVTRGLGPTTPLKPSGVDWLGDVPTHWETRKLREVVTSTTGGMTPSKADPRFWGGDVPWVTPKDMKSPEIRDSIDHISEWALNETGITVVEPPAVLMVVRGMILARTFPVAVSLAPVTLNQDMKALKTNAATMDPRFLSCVLSGLQGHIVDGLVEESGHGTRRLSSDAWQNLLVPVPPRQEQETLLLALESETARLDVALVQAGREIELLREYRTRLTADVVAGKVDVRGVVLPTPGEGELREGLDSLGDQGEDETADAEEAGDADE